MPSFSRRLALLVLITASATACNMVAVEDESSVADEQHLGTRAKPPTLPAPGGTGELAPWGGPNAARWRPEATLANATSEALNRAWARTDVEDVVVAVPAKMYSSQFAAFGDGQLNSVPSFAAWTMTERPPVVATLITFTNAPRKAILRFDRALQLTAIEIAYYVNGTRKLVDVAATRTASGDLESEWVVPDEVGLGLLSNAAVAIHPKGWGDWFPLWFRMPVRSIAELRASAAKFSDGKNIIDREGVSIQGEQSPTRTPYERLAGAHASSP